MRLSFCLNTYTSVATSFFPLNKVEALDLGQLEQARVHFEHYQFYEEACRELRVPSADQERVRAILQDSTAMTVCLCRSFSDSSFFLSLCFPFLPLSSPLISLCWFHSNSVFFKADLSELGGGFRHLISAIRVR